MNETCLANKCELCSHEDNWPKRPQLVPAPSHFPPTCSMKMRQRRAQKPLFPQWCCGGLPQLQRPLLAPGASPRLSRLSLREGTGFHSKEDGGGHLTPWSSGLYLTLHLAAWHLKKPLHTARCTPQWTEHSGKQNLTLSAVGYKIQSCVCQLSFQERYDSPIQPWA